MPQKIDSETGKLVLQAFIRERSLLTPMRILFERVGNFFQIPMASFHPYVVGGPEANRKVPVTDRNKFLWRNTNPVSDLLHQGVLVTDARAHLLAHWKISRWKRAVHHLWYLAGIDALAGTHGIRLELVWVEKRIQK